MKTLIDPKIQVIQYPQERLPQMPSDLLMITLKQILMTSPTNNRYRVYLTDQQWKIIKQCDPLIKTLNDFHYFVGHVTFYVPLMNFLLETLRQQQDLWILESFIAPPIQSWIYQFCQQKSRFRLLLPGQMIVDLIIIHPTGFKTPDQDSIIRSVARIIMMIQQVHHLSSGQFVKITYIMTPFRKKIHWYQPRPEINAILAQDNVLYNRSHMTNPITPLSVNSGLTNKGGGIDVPQNNDIVIWRKEEFEKVLIHELIHYFNLEKGTEFLSPFVNISANYPHYSKELFTELQTWYLYIIYCLRYRKFRSPISLQEALDQERSHSWANLCRILQHYQLTDWSQLVTPDPLHRLNFCSSTLYYYLFKAMLLAAHDPFIEWLMFPRPSNQINVRHQISQRTVDKLRQFLHHPILLTPITIPLYDCDSLRMMSF